MAVICTFSNEKSRVSDLYSHRFVILALLATLFGISGCQKAPQPEVVFGTQSSKPIGQFSDRINARVYLDATPSMQGFSTPGSAGQYGIFLQELELALQQGWNSTDAQWFSFGTRRDPIGQRPAYQPATNPSFYGRSGFLDTRIDIALEDVSPSSLIIVVTDLFQQDADISLLIEKIKQKVLPNHLAFAIVGARAEFKGTIYDVGQQKLSFPWDSKGDPNRYRPFYALIIGRTSDVLHLTEVFLSVSKIVHSKNLLLLSTDLVRTPLNWKTAKVTGSKGVNQNANVVRPAVPRGLVFKRIGRNNVEISANLVYDPIQSAPSVRFDKLSWDTRAILWRSGGLVETASTRQLSSDGPSTDNFHIGREGNDHLAIKVNIPPQRLPYRGTYIVALRPVLGGDIFDFPSFCSEWNFDVVATTKLAASGQFDGTKTQNLSAFIHSVWAVMLQDHQPDIGTLYFYLER